MFNLSIQSNWEVPLNSRALINKNNGGRNLAGALSTLLTVFSVMFIDKDVVGGASPESPQTASHLRSGLIILWRRDCEGNSRSQVVYLCDAVF